MPGRIARPAQAVPLVHLNPGFRISTENLVVGRCSVRTRHKTGQAPAYSIARPFSSSSGARPSRCRPMAWGNQAHEALAATAPVAPHASLTPVRRGVPTGCCLWAQAVMTSLAFALSAWPVLVAHARWQARPAWPSEPWCVAAPSHAARHSTQAGAASAHAKMTWPQSQERPRATYQRGI